MFELTFFLTHVGADRHDWPPCTHTYWLRLRISPRCERSRGSQEANAGIFIWLPFRTAAGVQACATQTRTIPPLICDCLHHLKLSSQKHSKAAREGSGASKMGPQINESGRYFKAS